MSYSDFKTLEKAVNDLDIVLEEIHNLFVDVIPVQPSSRLQETLAETLELATNISTEKARSELIITPILLEIRRLFPDYLLLLTYYSPLPTPYSPTLTRHNFYKRLLLP